jgi:hypothetical protein
MKKYYEVRQNDFHGGRVVSRHRSPHAAALAVIKYDREHARMGCSCGGGALCSYYADADAEPVRCRLYYDAPHTSQYAGKPIVVEG